MVSLNRRFNTLFLLLVAIPLLVVSVLLSRLYMDALVETVSGHTQDLLEQIAQNVEKELNNVSVLAAVLLYDQDLEKAARERTDAPVGPDRIEADWRMTQRLGAVFTVANRIGAIAVYLKDGSVVTSSNYPNIRSFSLADAHALRQARSKPGEVVIADGLSGVTENGGGRFILSALVCPPDSTVIDALLVMVRVPYLDQFANYPLRRDEAGLVLLGRDGTLLMSNVADLGPERATLGRLAHGNAELTVGGRPSLVNVRALGTAPWTFVLVMDRASITDRLMVYQWYLYPALGLMVGLFLVFSMVFFARVTKPILEVIDNMRRLAAGQEPRPFRPEGIRELSALTDTFDHMVTEIRRLDDERRQQSERRLAAEIQALQFQISPHFVANTLNSIRMMALAAQNHGIRDMTQALIRLLAESYASVDPATTLSNEVANLANYLSIMRIRFGEHFRVKYELGEDTLNCQVLRMSLQPLVENAILHGFAGLDRQGVLVIRSRREDQDLVLEVADNGVGMDEGLRASLLETVPQGPIPRIGVHNVHERLKLNFGGGYGLSITSRLGEGTTVTVTMPCREAQR